MVLDAAPDVLLHRLRSRPVTAVVSRIIEERGGDSLVLGGRRQLLETIDPSACAYRP